MSEKWSLKRTAQCAKCPWRVEVDPYDIPNGYDPEKHQALKNTIARPGMLNFGWMEAMACHETEDAYCIGWLVNQLGTRNNLSLRLRMFSCENASKIRLRGKQHERFEDTLPEGY